MRSKPFKTMLKTAVLAVTILLLATGASFGQTVSLTATRTTTLLPDGNTVPMWGYSCGAVSGATCVPLQAGALWSPPLITVPYSSTGTNLSITLTNSLPVPTSLMIVGQLGGGLGSPVYMPSPAHPGQTQTTWPANTAATFTPPVQPPRARSLVPEAPPGSTANTYTYTWGPTAANPTAPPLKPGTYLIETGTRPSIQGPMGLYGVLVVGSAPVAVAATISSISESGTTVTVTTALPNTFALGNTVTISGVTPAGYNGTFVINSVVSTTQFTYTAATSGLISGSTGTVSVGSLPSGTLQAYPGVAYDADGTMLFSEIDPVQNASVDRVAAYLIAHPTAVVETIETTPWNPACSAAGTCYPPAVDYTPLYFLINGQSFDKTAPLKSTIQLPTTSASGNVLLRFVNASPRMHIPSVVGQTMWLIAEDGNLLPDAGPGKFPKRQNEVFLSAGKVYDAVIMPPAGTTAGAFANATYPVFDRQLSLTANNQTGGGMQAYLQIGTGGTAGAGPNQGGTGFAAPKPPPTPPPAASAVADSYTLGPNLKSFSNNVLTNDTGVSVAALKTLPLHGTVVMNPNGTFTYTPTGPFIVGDSFTYYGNGNSTLTTLTATVTITATLSTSPPSALNDTFTSNVATLLKVSGPGVLANDIANGQGPLTALFVSATGVSVTLNANGSFTAIPTGTGAHTFTYKAVNAKGVPSVSAATVTLAFSAASNLQVQVHDALDSSAAGVITDYRWVIEEDKTMHMTPGKSTGAGVPILGTSFHRSFMPVVAQGCVGLISCGSGQSLMGTLIPAAQQPQSNPSQVNLPAQDSTGAPKYYFISVLPGDAANPVLGTDPPAHTMGGALISPVCNGTLGTNSTTGAPTCSVDWVLPTTSLTNPLKVLVESSPVPVAQLSVFIFEDSSPTNGDVDGNEQFNGLGDFEIILNDIAAATGDPTGQMTYDMFNMPLTNALIGQPGCPDTHNKPGTAVVADDNSNLVGVIYTCPNGSGIHQILGINHSPPAPGTLGSWVVTITTADANNFFYTGEPVTIAGVGGTGYNGTFNITVTGPNTFTYLPGPTPPSNNPSITGSTASDTLQYQLAGHALIKNLFPNRFDVIANPSAARDAAGEIWYQTSTLEGTRPQDAFAKAGEPPYFQEFGPPGFHSFIGFINPAHIAAANTTGGTHQIQGRVTMQHMSRPSSEILYDSGSNATLAHSTCFVGLNTAGGDGDNISFAKCNQDGTFTLTGVPEGTHQVVVWDQWLDQIINYTAVTVNPGDPPTINIDPTNPPGDIPVFSWFQHVKASIFMDLHGAGGPGTPPDGVRQADEPGIAQIPVRLRFRDGSISNTLLTDGNGYAFFHELFPLFNWFVIESDDTRFKNTGVTTVVDGGGKVDTSGAYAGILQSLYPPYNASGVGQGGTTVKTFLGTDTLGLQGFVSQTQFLDFGKTPYVPGENGGIRGTVVFASTRPFDDPNIGIQNVWAPLVPNVTVNLYQESTASDGTLILTKVDTTLTSSWDDWVNHTGQYAGMPAMSCPGQAPVCTSLDPDLPVGCDRFLNFTLGEANRTKCYDGFHNWNQVQPAIYDGQYKFPSSAYVTAHPLAPALPPGKYVTEVVVPPGYEIVKEEDKNILIGDTFGLTQGSGPPVSQQFGGLSNIFILPDQASINAYNAYNANNPTTNLGRSVFSEFGPGAQINLSAPCVGTPRIVPDYLSLYPQAQQVAPFAGATRNLCDRREVILEDQMQASANFFIFTPTPIAGHFTGMILDDASNEFNVTSPDWGEKFGVPFVPVSFKDFNGIEISRTYSDEFGMFNGVTYSTWAVNPPNPTGYAPNMMITCMNDPGPILDTRPACTGTPPPAGCSTTHGKMITDPMYNPMYSNFCYTNPFMPGRTDYMDTPVLPIASFASGYNPPDCAQPANVPAINRVDTSAGAFGPWLPSASGTVTITALGDVQVPNPAYAGPRATAPPANQKTILRHYGFGGSKGTVSIGNVTVSGGAITTWTDSTIVFNVPGTARTGQLVVTTAGGQSSIDAVTLTIETTTPTYVSPGLPDANGRGPIQAAIDNASPGALIMLNGAFAVSPTAPAGTSCASVTKPTANCLAAAASYPELVIMWKPVRLQGVGAASVIINAAKYPTEKLNYWRPRINQLFGIDSLGNLTLPALVDPLPGQEITGGVILLEPTVLASEEGAGITVLAKNLGTASTSPSQVCIGGNGPPCARGTFVYNFNTYPSRIDGLSVTGSDAGGGIYVNGWAHKLEISNTRVYGNAGAYNGGIRIGQPFLEGQALPTGFDARTFAGFGYDVNVKIHNNAIYQNGVVEDNDGAGAGISICSGTDGYLVSGNWICGNFTLADAGGIGHLGLSNNGVISHNQILFNQEKNPEDVRVGGGLGIIGEPSTLGGLTVGTGNVTVDGNLIQGNFSEAGHGGGIGLKEVNGDDVTANPTTPAMWWKITVTNNIIVNNVAGWSGGGIYLADTVNSSIINNTVADNDSTAIVGALIGPTGSLPQPAGISSDLNTAGLCTALATAPSNLRCTGTSRHPFSNPTLDNNIVWHNRAFYFNNNLNVAGSPSLLLPLAANNGYWDLGIVGDTSPILATGAFRLNPLNSTLTNTAGYGNTNNSTNPNFVLPYFNGARDGIYPGLGGSTTGMSVAVAIDEGGNNVALRYGPLFLYGNYTRR